MMILTALIVSLSLLFLVIEKACAFSIARGSNTVRRRFQSKLEMNAAETGPFRGPDTSPILDSVRFPSDMKRLDIKQLKQLCNELRWDTLNSVSKVGGHLGSSLGVVELTVALHYVFDAPEDRIVWDVAHQAYPHKILTGRRDRMHTLRQMDGLSGFTKRSESEYDCFGAGHSSTSISAALGMSAGKILLNKQQNNCIAVIGDGAITGGMAYEAMNNAAYINSRVVVILNDNGQVSLPTGQPSAGGVVPAGALSGYTSRLLTSNAFKTVRDIAKSLNALMPGEVQRVNKKFDEYVRGMATGGTLFEELGFFYVGPTDGHDLENLIPILENIRDNVPITKPVLLHVKTTKGKGYPPAEAASDKYHGVAKFDVASGKQKASIQSTVSYTNAFAHSLINIAEQDRKVVAITAAMPGGTGVDKFGRRFPKRTYDVGIAEQHAVTFAAGLAVEGIKPFVAIYSTFLQRAYDQVIHDVCLQQLPVRFIIDRAGLVGNDGATHHGNYDLAYLGCVPDLIVMAPAEEIDLQNMVETAYHIDHLPSAVRFPRGSGYGWELLQDIFGYTAADRANVASPLSSSAAAAQSSTSSISPDNVLPTRGKALPIGKGRILKKGSAGKKYRVAIASIGTRAVDAVLAARQLENTYPDLSVMVTDARFLKPFDEEMLRDLATMNDVLITVEEGSRGGYATVVNDFLLKEGLLDLGTLRVRNMYIPDIWIEAGSQQEQYEIAGLQRDNIVQTVESVVEKMRSHRPQSMMDVKALDNASSSFSSRSLSTNNNTNKYF